MNGKVVESEFLLMFHLKDQAMQRILFIFASLICFTFTYAQEKKQKITGTVSDGLGPIQAVNISIVESNLGTTSDKNGKYEITVFPKDVLEFSYLGKQTITVIVEDVTRILNIEMLPDYEELDEVVVTKSKRKTQRDLAIDYAIDKNIVNTSFGYLSPETSAYRIGVIDGSELNNAAIDILSAIQGKLAGMRVQTYKNPKTKIEERALFMGSGGSMRGGTPVVFEVDGILYADVIPTWIDINSVERIGVLPGIQATWRFGSIAAGGVIFINTKNGAHGVKEENTGLPYDRAKLRNNIFDKSTLGAIALLQAAPNYLRELHNSESISEAEAIYIQNADKYKSSPYYFIDSYVFFKEKGQDKFAENIAKNAMKQIEQNSMFLKAWAYNLEANDQFERANEIYEKVFILRPHYIQSYRDLAESYRSIGNFNKSAAMYARYQYLKGDDFLAITDSTHINTIIERESDNLVALEGDNLFNGVNTVERPEKFIEFDGTRLVFEWNDSEAEFDLQFVNPQKRYHTWEHTMFADFERINDEKSKGYSTQEFLMDGSLPGKWQINVNYKGNKRLEPIYLKASIFYNYGQPSQRKEVKVFRLSLKNVNQKLFDIINSGRISTN